MAGPLYRQIADQLRQMIESGDLKSGTQVPTEDQLMEEYQASRNTVRGALKELATRNLVYTRYGKGTFVSERVRPIIITLTSDPETGRGGGEGRVYSTEVAASGREPANGPARGKSHQSRTRDCRLAADPGEDRSHRRHENGHVDDLPWQRQTSYYPRSLEARAPRLLETSNIREGVVAYLAETRYRAVRVPGRDRHGVRPTRQRRPTSTCQPTSTSRLPRFAG